MQQTTIPRFGRYEQSLHHAGSYANPYRDCAGEVELSAPDGSRRLASLFWDGETTWRLRFSPDQVGDWHWRSRSADAGLDGASGSFTCTTSEAHGGITTWPEHPYALRYQDGSPYWAFGDTHWSHTCTRPEDGCDRAAAMRYAERRAAQGFNLLNIKLQAWGRNEGGDAWNRSGSYDPVPDDEPLNPAFWQEVDRRLQHLEDLGITAFLYIAWQKRDPEAQLVSWDMFPDHQARLRYARYIAARYAAGNVLFCVAGEWKPGRGAHLHGDSRAGVAAIGAELRHWDPQRRLLCVHGGGRGTTHPWFAHEPWCDLADCQQVYRERHAEILLARGHRKPVFNAEYGYWLRKFHDGMDGPGGMRAISWEIAMAGGFLVTGWGSTYFGGLRHPTAFGCDADPGNGAWDEQVVHLKTLFERLPWWRLDPHDELLRGEAAHAYCLAESGGCHVAYVQGAADGIRLGLLGEPDLNRAELFDPRSGASQPITLTPDPEQGVVLPLPDEQDWVVIIDGCGV